LILMIGGGRLANGIVGANLARAAATIAAVCRCRSSRTAVQAIRGWSRPERSASLLCRDRRWRRAVPQRWGYGPHDRCAKEPWHPLGRIGPGVGVRDVTPNKTRRIRHQQLKRDFAETSRGRAEQGGVGKRGRPAEPCGTVPGRSLAP